MSLRTGIVPVQLAIYVHASFSPYTLPKKVIRCALTPFFWKGNSKIQYSTGTVLYRLYLPVPVLSTIPTVTTILLYTYGIEASGQQSEAPSIKYEYCIVVLQGKMGYTMEKVPWHEG